MNADLNDQILAAHALGDHRALIAHYSAAADASTDTDEICFFLTYAYVFALELGDASEAVLYQRLKAYGRV